MLATSVGIGVIPAEKPPPIYIGFGNMVGHDREKTTENVLEAIKLARVRAVLLRGWSGLAAGVFPMRLLW